MEQMLLTLRTRDGSGYVPPTLHEIGIQADEIKEDVPDSKPKKKKDIDIKETDPEVKLTFSLFHVLPDDFVFDAKTISLSNFAWYSV